MAEWYNPETGRVEEIPDEFESPYERAHREGRGAEFDAATKAYYEHYPTGDATGTAQDDTNWYDPNTWARPESYIDHPNWPGNTRNTVVGNEPRHPSGTPSEPEPPKPRPIPRGGGGSWGGGRGGGFSYSEFVPPSFDVPAWAPPASTVGAFTAPSFDVPAPPAPFTYPAYQRLTEGEFQADPGYAFRRGEMLDTIRNERAAEGILRTSGTLDELMRRAGGFASSEFGNVEGRRFRDWTANRDLSREESEAAVRRNEVLYGRESDEYRRALATHQQLRGDEAQAFDQYRTGYLVNYGREADEFSRALDTHRTNFGGAATGYGLNLDTRRLEELQLPDMNWRNLLSLYDISTRGLPGAPTFPYL